MDPSAPSPPPADGRTPAAAAALIDFAGAHLLAPPPPAALLPLPPSHPLAPPPQPFPDAVPTAANVAFDPPPPAAAPLSLKRDAPDDAVPPPPPQPPLPLPPSALGDLLNGPAGVSVGAGGGPAAGGTQPEEHAAKRAKLEEPPALPLPPAPAPALPQQPPPPQEQQQQQPPFAPQQQPPPPPPQQQQQQQQQSLSSPLPQQAPSNASPAPATAPPPPPPSAAAPAPAPVQTGAYPVDPYAGGLPAQYALGAQGQQQQQQQQQQPQPQPQQQVLQPWEAPPSQPQPQQQQPQQQPQAQQPTAPPPAAAAGSFVAQPLAPGSQPLSASVSAAGTPPASSSAAAASGPPAAAAAAAAAPSLPLSQAQQKFFLALVRALRKLPQAYAFLSPVDPVAMGIPHYLTIISHPMDLGTIEAKLQASGPKGKGKKGGGAGRYLVKEQAVEDFRRVWGNSDRFNGREHAVSNAGRALEELFEKSLPGCPPDEEPKPPTPKPASAFVAGGPVGARRESLVDGRPKRDVHPPPAKDAYLSAVDAASARRKSGGGAGGGKRGKHDEQWRFLRKEIDACFKGKVAELCWPFLAPVDPIAMNIPEYPSIVKRPMDLSTVRANLAEGAYDDPVELNQDVKLMLRNCFAFNPPGTAVYDAGKNVEAYWQGRWRALPPAAADDSEPEEDEHDSAEEEIVQLEGQIATLTKRLEHARARRAAKRKAKADRKRASAGGAGALGPPGAGGPSSTAKPKPPKQAAAAAGASVAPPKKKAASGGGGAGGGGGHGGGQPKPPKKQKPRDASDGDLGAGAVTMAQKQELAEKIQSADGDVLNKAIAIIQDSTAAGTDGSDEIELDIDSLAPAVVLKLYNLVVRGPRKKSGAAGSAGGKGGANRGGTGGLNRKSMNEDAESEKIRLLEEKMRAFEGGGGGGGALGGAAPGGGGQAPPGAYGHGGGDDSEDESGSDSASESD